MEEEIIKQIKEQHQPSYKGILYSYGYKDIKESYPFYLSILLSAISFIVVLIGHKNLYDVVVFWTNQVIAIFPNLLGFNLGGFALIVGFGNTELIQAMTSKGIGRKVSVFQKAIGVFGFTLLLQSITFIFAFILNFSIQLKFETNIYWLVDCVNILTLLILSFLGLWSLFIMPILVLNLFTFGQMHHYYLTIKRIKEENE